MEILVLGYYNRSNLGDEMFKAPMQALFPGYQLSFYNTHDYVDINAANINKYKAIIVGGGDLINDYFFEEIKRITQNYTGILIGMCIGIPFPDLIDKGYCDIFDHIFIREKTDLRKLQQRLGSCYVHYLPDLAFGIDAQPSIVKPSGIINKRRKRVGVFLAQPLSNFKNLRLAINKFISTLCRDYQVILYAFNTFVASANDCDLNINHEVLKEVNHFNLSCDDNTYTPSQMMSIIGTLDYAVCARYHAHIFCTIKAIPYMSICTTRKVELFMKEDGLSMNVKHFDVNEATLNNQTAVSLTTDLLGIFTTMVSHQSSFRSKLITIAARKRFLLSNNQAAIFVAKGAKRPTLGLAVDPKLIKSAYDEARNMMISQAGFDPSSHTNKPNIQLSASLAETIASNLCMTLTNDPSSKYLYGTIQNIQTNPGKLQEFVNWIVADKLGGVDNDKKFNLSYISQDSFRGLHRSGWQYTVNNMMQLDTPNGVICDTYVDRTFGWSKAVMKRAGIIPYTSPWVGFIHHTQDVTYSHYNNVNMLNDTDFQRSLEVCSGLYLLSHNLAQWWRHQLKLLHLDVRVNVLTHPTEFNGLVYQPNPSNKSKPMLVNVGAWYRNPFSIHLLDLSKTDYTKASLRGKRMENYFMPVPLVITKDMYNSVDENKPNMSFNHSNDHSGELEKEINKLEKEIEKDLGDVGCRLIKYLSELGCRLIHDIGCRNTNNSVPSINKWVIYFLKYLHAHPKLLDGINLKDDVIIDMAAAYKDKAHLKLQQQLKTVIDSVKIIDTVDNVTYDKLLANNVVFLDLIDCSAVNTIIECIVRNTPVVVNRLPGTIELLTKDYPLFYDKLTDVPKLLKPKSVKKAHEYLTKLNKERFRIEYFNRSLISSEIYGFL